MAGLPQYDSSQGQPDWMRNTRAGLGAASNVGNVANAFNAVKQGARATRLASPGLPSLTAPMNADWAWRAGQSGQAGLRGLYTAGANYLGAGTRWAQNATPGVSRALTPMSDAAQAAKPGMLSRAASATVKSKPVGLFRAAGKLAVPVTLATAGFDTWNTPTEAYAKRFGADNRAPSFLGDVGLRLGGAISDVANQFAFGQLDRFFADKQQPAAPTAPQGGLPRTPAAQSRPAAVPAPVAAAPATGPAVQNGDQSAQGPVPTGLPVTPGGLTGISKQVGPDGKVTYTNVAPDGRVFGSDGSGQAGGLPQTVNFTPQDYKPTGLNLAQVRAAADPYGINSQKADNYGALLQQFKGHQSDLLNGKVGRKAGTAAMDADLAALRESGNYQAPGGMHPDAAAQFQLNADNSAYDRTRADRQDAFGQSMAGAQLAWDKQKTMAGLNLSYAQLQRQREAQIAQFSLDKHYKDLALGQSQDKANADLIQRKLDAAFVDGDNKPDKQAQGQFSSAVQNALNSVAAESKTAPRNASTLTPAELEPYISAYKLMDYANNKMGGWTKRGTHVVSNDMRDFMNPRVTASGDVELVGRDGKQVAVIPKSALSQGTDPSRFAQTTGWAPFASDDSSLASLITNVRTATNN